MNEYPTATTAASVGEKIPPQIPPMMMIGVRRLRKASLVDTSTSLILKVCFGYLLFLLMI